MNGPGVNRIWSTTLADGVEVPNQSSGLTWRNYRVATDPETLYVLEFSTSERFTYGGVSYKFKQWSYSGLPQPDGLTTTGLEQTSEQYHPYYNSGYLYITAIYERDEDQAQSYTIETCADPANAGQTTGDGIYQSGAQCTISCTPAAGYVFRYWSSDKGNYASTQSYTFNVFQDEEWTAHFGNGEILCDSSSGVILSKYLTDQVLCS